MPHFPTDDTRIVRVLEVRAPDALLQQHVLTDRASELVYRTRREIGNVLRGEDRRLVVVVGPCSIHDPDAALDYARRLKAVADRLANELLIVMRVYFEKPRTTVGWKGLINDPHLDGSYDIDSGLSIARRLLVELAELGVPAGTEYLDPITPQYLGDVISWGAIGARTTESQIHRQLASGLSCPVGFKNGTDGSVQIAVDAIQSAAASHIFLSVTKHGHCAIVETAGNNDCHVILRGGAGGPNYDVASVTATVERLGAAGLPKRVMIDCSHGNSAKDIDRQLGVAMEIAQRIRDGESHCFGLMIESHLVAGRQGVDPGRQLVYGQSITDACIGWESTERALDALAKATRLP